MALAEQRSGKLFDITDYSEDERKLMSEAPSAVNAGQEDFADSSERLAQVRDAYFA